MNAMVEPIAFQLPKKPRIKEKDAPPDQRKVAVVPIRALTDSRLTDGAFRVLALLCSYCNRAGITWVSQKRLAEDAKVSRQAITNQIAQLREHGYVEIVRKGFRGERANTVRVIFDQTISAEDAMAITSSQEDTRPPAIKEEQMNQEVDPEGQRRIAQLVAKALKQPPKPKEYSMPKTGQTRTVQIMHEQIRQTKAKRSQSVNKPVNKPVDDKATIGHPTVSNESSPEVSNEGLHRQPIGHPGVSQNTERTHKDRDIKVNDKNKDKVVLRNLNVEDFDSLIDSRMTPEQIEDALETLLPLFQAEGLNPSSRVLADAVLQLHRDAR